MTVRSSPMKLNKIGGALALVYAVAAFVVALQDFNCGGGLDINICGLGTMFVTFPSYLIVGRLFSKIGLAINFRHRSPSASDLALLTTHVIICAVIIYLVTFVVGRMISHLRTWRTH